MTTVHVIRGYQMGGMLELEGDNLQGSWVGSPLGLNGIVQATPTRGVSCR